MKALPPSPVGVFETKFCVGGWTAIGLAVRGVLGSTSGELKIFASIALVEVGGLLVATDSKAVPAETAHCGDYQ